MKLNPIKPKQPVTIIFTKTIVIVIKQIYEKY